MSTVSLPSVIARYFAAKGNNAAEALSCFESDAVVWDNGEDLEIRGAEAIGQWLDGTSTKYKLTSEVKSIEEIDDVQVVAVVVTGDFPGSPYEFAYRFTLAGDKIRELAIDPVGSLSP